MSSRMIQTVSINKRRPIRASDVKLIEQPLAASNIQRPSIRVMLADDHELIRQGLRAVLEQEDDIVIIGEASTGLRLVKAIEAGARPDVVLVDLQMPEMTGVEATERIHQLMPAIKIIGLSAVEEESARSAMLQAGASDYIIKSAAAEKLVHAIRTAMAHASHGHHFRASNGYGERKAAQESESEALHEGLTPREKDVMRVLMQGYSNKEIARRLVISERTVQTHLGNIFSKMEVNSRTEAVLVAMRDGWLTIG